MTPSQSPRGRFEELDGTECFRLISMKNVGRVAITTADGPRIYPVNYILHEGIIVFRTSSYAEMAKYLLNGQAAFEVDELDEFLQAGWSVVVVGHAHYVDDDDDLPDRTDMWPEPWAPGVRTLFIRIKPVSVTGRRIHPA